MARKNKSAATAAAPLKMTREVDFLLEAPHAQSVLLVGEFNQWNQSQQPLQKRAEGTWGTRMTLAPGRYQYRYLVDGCWVNDPAATECVPNDFGGTNCIKIVS